MQPDATIIIPQYHHPELTDRCIATLRQFDTTLWPVMVIDDGSPDWCVAELKSKSLLNVTLIGQQHRGISAAWNRGAQLASTRFVIFLNNDAASTGRWVDHLLRPLREGSCCLAGKDLRQEVCLPSDVLQMLPTTMFVEGWCFAVHLKHVHRIGGFDESMRLYWSDTDFQARLCSIQNSRRARFAACPRALPLRHLGHRTAHDRACVPNRRRQWSTDRAAFIAKWRRASRDDCTSWENPALLDCPTAKERG